VNGTIGASVFVDSGGTLYVYYDQYPSNRSLSTIAYASGGTYRSLSKQGTVLGPGASGQWDSAYVSAARLFVDNGNYYLYYLGSQNTGFEGMPGSIGVATATSPAGPWTKYSGNPILAPGGGTTWDADILFHAYVFKNGSTYYMFYNARRTATNKEQIGYATASSPLGPWTKNAGNPVFTNGANWSANIVGDPFVLPNGPNWTMTYYGAFPVGIGTATSPDLNTWTDQNPVTPISISGAAGAPLERAALFTIGTQTYALVDDNFAIYAVQINGGSWSVAP
jgi:beta-xylosidase